MKEIILNGNNFKNLTEFFDEVEAKLTRNLDWKIGRNLNAFNDLLRGGFGVHELGEKIKIRWINSNKSKEDLGQQEAVRYLKRIIKTCHPSIQHFIYRERT